MNTTLLDVSRCEELTDVAPVIGDLESGADAAKVTVLIAGAFARDLHLAYGHRIPTGRKTEDVDFGVAVEDWDRYAALKAQLEASGSFRTLADPHRVIHRSSETVVDLVPFHGIEDDGRSIAWPPHGETRMNVFGFREALVAAIEVRLPGGVRSRVVSLPALALLKLVAWQDRHHNAPRKDAHDLCLIARHYLDCGEEDRVLAEFERWTQEADFEYQLSGPRMLGHDIADLLASDDCARVSAILTSQIDETVPGILPGEMMPADADGARALLRAMLRGISGHHPSR